MEVQVNIINTIVKQAQEGSKIAYEKLYNDYKNAMYSTCLRLMGNMDDAHDMLQEGFIQAFSKLDSLKEPEKFGGWLKTIIIRRCLKQCKLKFINIELTDQYDVMEDNEQNIWHNISITSIELAIRKLPEGCRQVFTLFAIENLPHAAIADALSISEGTSKSQYHRARQLLQKSLVKQFIN